MPGPSKFSFPSLEEIASNKARLGDLVTTTPVRLVTDDAIGAALGASTVLWLKKKNCSSARGASSPAAPCL